MVKHRSGEQPPDSPAWIQLNDGSQSQPVNECNDDFKVPKNLRNRLVQLPGGPAVSAAYGKLKEEV